MLLVISFAYFSHFSNLNMAGTNADICKRFKASIWQNLIKETKLSCTQSLKVQVPMNHLASLILNIKADYTSPKFITKIENMSHVSV